MFTKILKSKILNIQFGNVLLYILTPYEKLTKLTVHFCNRWRYSSFSINKCYADKCYPSGGLLCACISTLNGSPPTSCINNADDRS